jgi:hypothetical protein
MISELVDLIHEYGGPSEIAMICLTDSEYDQLTHEASETGMLEYSQKRKSTDASFMGIPIVVSSVDLPYTIKTKKGTLLNE